MANMKRKKPSMSADQLKKVRASLGLTQQQFSNELAVSIRTLQEWERGNTAVPPSIVLLIECVVKRLQENQSN